MVNLWDAVVSHDVDTPVHWKKNRNKPIKPLKKLEIAFSIIFLILNPIILLYFLLLFYFLIFSSSNMKISSILAFKTTAIS